MNAKRDDYFRYNSDAELGAYGSKFHEKFGKCYRKYDESSHCSLAGRRALDFSGISIKSAPESNYITHIVFVGVRSDNVYEVKLLLAPEVDISTIRITVKNKNLRVSVQRSTINNAAKHFLQSIDEKSEEFNEIAKRISKHSENFLIPETIDGDKVRAVVDNKNRTLILTAPTLKPSKAFKRRFSSMLNL